MITLTPGLTLAMRITRTGWNAVRFRPVMTLMVAAIPQRLNMAFLSGQMRILMIFLVRRVQGFRLPII
jgi:hypothetical protein